MTNIPETYLDGAIYDARFPHVLDVPFYRQRIHGDCLELCCGTGRILLELAAAGIDAHGLDFAPAMLNEARKKAAARGLTVHLTQGDIRDFDLGRTFSTIFIPANSISHVYTLDDMQRHLACVRRHMRADSQYIVDMFVPRFDLLIRTGRYEIMDYVDPTDGRNVVIYEEAHYDNATQIKHMVWSHEKDGQIVRSERTNMRMFFPQELDALLTFNGLRIVEKFGDHDGSPFVDGSPKQIIVCALSDF